jgi:RNA-binding protein Musashi
MKDALTRRSRGFGFITYIDIESLDKALDAAPHSIDGRKVEAKRAVPRADGSSGPIKPVVSSSSSSVVAATATSTSSSTATKAPNSSVSGSGSISSGSTGGSVSSGSLPTGLGAPTSYAQLLHDNSSGGSSSREPRLNMDEYAYNKVFVGGLHFDTRELEMRAYFSKYGKIVSAEVMINRETHKSRGFGFVVFEQERFAEAVCREKDHVIDSKIVEVKRAIPRSKMIALASGGGAEKPVPAAPTAPSSPSPASGSDTPKKTNTPSASVSHSPTSAASFAALAAKIGQPGAYRTAAAASALASNSAASASTTSSPATSTTSTISNNSGAAADTSTFTYAAALTSKLPLSSQGQTAFLGARSSNSSFDNTSFESDLLSLSSLGGEEPALSVGGLTLGAGLLGLERTDQHAGLYTRSTRSNSMRSDSFSSTVGSRSESGYETGALAPCFSLPSPLCA